MKIGRFVLTTPAIVLLTLVASATALWLGGLSITGSFLSVGGNPPESVVLDEPILILNTSDHYYSYLYENTDGTVVMSFTGELQLVSGHENCNIDDMDYTLEVLGDSGWANAATGVELTLPSGFTDIQWRVVPHANACPADATSSYSLVGLIG